MDYHFDELDPVAFQRLIHALLQHHYGETLRTGPLRGPDGGVDAEAIVPDSDAARSRVIQPGRHLFQIKHHRMTDADSTELRQRVLREYVEEAKKCKVADDEQAFFHLITNVSSSSSARRILDGESMTNAVPRGRVWWQSDVIAMLDRTPSVWPAFPELFAGRIVPILGELTSANASGPAATLRAAIVHRYNIEKQVRFRQIDLEKDLARLFIDPVFRLGDDRNYAALNFLLSEAGSHLLVEGGPGQGKSTVTQMLAQIHRHELLGRHDMQPEERWRWPDKPRIPLRVELSRFAEAGTSLEQYLVSDIVADAGGGSFTIDDLRRLIRDSPMLLVLDGLDEVGSDALRDQVISEILFTIQRIESGDVSTILTSRPPAVAGRRQRLEQFLEVVLLPLSDERIGEYIDRWCSQLAEERDRQEVKETFAARRNDSHVAALASNPMQLSVLLHLIRMKGPALPTKRAELYRDYFERVIDRDVEKSADARQHRELITNLHQFLAFEIHSRVETGESDGTLPRERLITLVNEWLKGEAGASIDARTLFKIGEERLGLIVSPRGEGDASVYGFEIQPIREYFAAAYLDQNVAGDAHEIFEQLLQRPFWHEVALFLAGLLHPNKRADLIARAKQVDADPQNGWRQRGRSIIWKLLQEGVFAQQHVYELAIEFVSDLLDEEIVPFGVEPVDFELRDLMTKKPSKKLGERVQRLLTRQRTSSDLGAMLPLIDLAPALLPRDVAARTIASLEPHDRAVLPVLRLRQPIMDMHTQTFWEVTDPAAWARVIWSAAERDQRCANDSIPASLHSLLLEQFASYPAGAWAPQRDSLRRLVWYFAELEFAIVSAEAGSSAEVRATLNAAGPPIDISGLPESEGRPLLALANAGMTLLGSHPNKRHAANAAATFLAALTECLSTPGLVSTVAARHATAVLFIDSRVDRLLPRKIVDPQLASFYGDGRSRRVDRLHAIRTQLAPQRTVIHPGEKPVDIVSVLINAVRRRQSPVPFDFVSRWSFNAEDCARMMEVTASELELLFEIIGPFGWDAGLLTEEQTHRLFAVLARTNSTRVKLCVLATMDAVPTSVDLPIENLVAAMEADRSGRFAVSVFWALAFAHRKPLAEAVMKSPLRFATYYRQLAAYGLAAFDPAPTLPPLRQLRDQLKLYPAALG